jgi:eukaryotic-like serine/threonine-protein kinase
VDEGEPEREPEPYGPYLVYEAIGQGGMASVYRAEQQLRDGSTREVALKRMFPSMKKELVSLFLDEARLLSCLDHPNIAATYDSGRIFGTYYIAMEYVAGPTLKQLVEHCRDTVGAVPQPIALNLAAQLCDALDHAHNACDENGNHLGIIHRDVTPANLIISPTGTLKLIDFGLAKAQLSTDRTSAGIIKGKFGYVAPEYLAGHLDLRADLWAVGIIMYELLTSRRLFDGPDALETMQRVKSMPIPRPSIGNPQVTRELDEVVMTALERDPNRRWQSAAQMRDRLKAVLASTSAQYVDQAHVAEWIAWVFTQQKGRPPQLTPLHPVPIIMPQSPLLDPMFSPSDAMFTPPARPVPMDPARAANLIGFTQAPMLPETRSIVIWMLGILAGVVAIGVIARIAG